MEQAAAQPGGPGVLTEIPRQAPVEIPGAPAIARREVPALNIALFLLTLLTTTMAGAYAAVDTGISVLHPIESLRLLSAGLSFSIPLMAILLAHEMGHYVTSRRYGVDTSLPYFIPAPFPSLFIVGTFGAFIRMRSMPRSRRVMFDIGAAGPWAGVLVAIPCVIIGLSMSQIGPLGGGGGGIELGNSLLFLGLTRWVLGVNPSLVSINLHPAAFAGWLGLFVTTLNLLPVGQLDGGHVTYALFPRQHRRISKLFVITCVLMVVVPLALGYSFWGGWLLWAVIAVALGLGHPSTVDRDTPLNPVRRFAAWATIALFIATFSPVPVSINFPESGPPSHESQVYDVMHRAPGHVLHVPHHGTVRI
ncbi:MAG TPA: site-2 protease family protein [Candidatus Binataceae bacterium]|nr:site-2 protease family protein [Candidatus Binataceae bacterium]